MKILLTGPQGSGKSTQAKLLAKKYGLAFISAGDLSREKAQEDSIDGGLARQSLGKGELLPDELVGRLVREKVENLDREKGIVLDGFPRSIDQLQYFDPNFDKVFYLDVPDEEVEKRLLLRGREDDTPELIRERLSIYHQLTEPVLQYYQQQGKLIRIDGTKNIEEVTAEVEGKIVEKSI